MKHLFIILLFALSFSACQKDPVSHDTYSDDTTEIQDFDDIADETPIYESEATKIKIESVEPQSSVSSSSCDKFVNYFKLNTQTSTTFKIKGYGFNASQGQSKVKFLFRNNKELRPVTVVSWSNTEINVTIGTLPTDTKNVPIWFRVEREDSTGMKNAVSKLLKCVGVFNGIHFGQPMWEVEQQRALLSLSAPGTVTDITSAWTPTNGDVLSRATGDSKGVVVSSVVTGTGAKQKTTVTVYERNLNCKGSIQKKKYIFKDGALIPKAGETAFVKYQR